MVVIIVIVIIIISIIITKQSGCAQGELDDKFFLVLEGECDARKAPARFPCSSPLCYDILYSSIVYHDLLYYTYNHIYDFTPHPPRACVLVFGLACA